MICFELQDNEKFQIVWQRDFYKPFFASFQIVEHEIDKFLVIGNCDGYLYQIDCQTGEIVWKFATVDQKPIFTTVSIIKETNKSSIVFGCHDGFVRRIDWLGQKLVWQVDLQKPVYSSCFVCDPIVYAVTIEGLIVVLNLVDGKILFEFDLQTPTFSSPVIFANCMVVGTRDNHLYKIKFESD